MASNGFAKVLKRNSWRLTTILVYAVLEWVLIFLLLLSALFQYITTKFASFFGLHPPCLWCSRLDHIIEPKEPEFYRKLICERHAQEISLLGYCQTHRKLAETHGMCEECASSRPAHVLGSADGHESNPNWIACMSMVADMGFDPSKKTAAKRLLTNGLIDEFKPLDAQSEEKSINGWVSKDLCSCCNAPLNRKLYPHNIFKTILFSGGKEAIVKPQWNVLNYNDGVLEKDGVKIQSLCMCGGARMKISEVFTDSCNESEEASSSAASDGETESRNEEKEDNGSIGLEENDKDVSDSDTHCNELLPDEAQNNTRSLEVVVEEDDHDDDAGVHVQPDICIDKRIAYPEIVTQECAIVSDVTVTEIEMEDISNDQVTKRLGFIEEPPEAEINGLISEEATQALEDQNEDIGHQDEAPALDRVCNSFPEEESKSEAVVEKDVDTDAASSEVEPKSLEVFPNAEEDCTERSLDETVTVSQPFLVNNDEQSNSVTSEAASSEVAPKSLEVFPNAEENCTEHSLDETVTVSQTFPVNNDEQSNSVTSEGVADEPKVVEDSDVDRTKESEADHPTADIFAEVQATSTDVASQETIMEITPDMDMNSGKEEVHADECQVSEDIEVMSREEHTCNGHVEGVPDECSQNMDQTEIKTCHQNVQVDGDKIDEDRACETPRFIEGVQLLGKRLPIERRDSCADSLDGSVLSEFDGEVEVDRLKRVLASDRKALNTLYLELEEERNAAAVAANQTMAMITRLQEEKAAVQMEALQYQRMMEEQSEYDQEALQLLNEILVKREKEKQDLEKELEIYRKKVMRYEAKERRMEKRRKTEESESPISSETRDETPDNHSRRNRTSSSSSLSENSDDVSSDANDADDQLEAQQSNQNTPVDLIMSAGRGYDTEQRSSLDESLVDFEEERLSILEQLKVLEEKLHTLANDDQAGMAQAETNGIEDDMKRIDVDKETMETMNGNITPTARRGKAKRLLPLFDAINVEEDSMHNTREISSAADPSNDWRTVSMVVRDNNRIAIEEEVFNLYERLQALEADREFLKHTIKSLRKGDEGMKLLQEIAEHLRDLRRVELKARNFSDIM